MPSSRDLALLFLWLIACVIFYFIAQTFMSAAFVDGHYIPVSNDSFYHARRILDAAVGERGFYQFDDMIHVPEGSWVTWPWGYDYLMAKALGVALWVQPGLEPMAFLAYVPLAWSAVNIALFILLAREMRISTPLTGIAVLALVLSPTFQLLHGIGAIDHHFMELTFALAACWLGLRFLRSPNTGKNAVLLGIALAIAPAFHNGLFILQIPLLVTAVLLWLQKSSLSPAAGTTVALALTASTVAILLPSEPFWQLQFQFATLSWFHLYIGVCSSVVIVYLSRIPFSKKSLAALAGLSALLLVPMLVQVYRGSAFLTGDLIRLDDIIEVASPLRIYLDSGTHLSVTRYYSWLIVLCPLLLGLFALRLLRKPDAVDLLFSVTAILGMSLMLTQFRMHPFGVWALIVGAAYLVQELATKRQLDTAMVTVACLAIVAVAYQPPLRNQLFTILPPGLTRNYAAVRSLMPVLGDECAKNPGVVLAYPDEGHPIRYHTDCSVIVNNFLLTQQHGEKVVETNILYKLTPEQLLSIAPNVEYVFAHFYNLFDITPEGMQPTSLDEVKAANAPLFNALLLDDTLPREFQLLGELRVTDDRDIPFARVYRIVHEQP